VTRLVLLGASNIRRGLSAIVGTARAALEGPMAILGAFGHGRSYGKRSCIPFRCLPGILECGIWKALSEESESPALVLVADVGNDILYGESAATILGWVSECVGRFATARITIAGLPLPRLRALNRGRFLFFRSILFPSSRHSRDTVISAAEELDDGLRRLATSARARFVEPDPAWYGADPIHIRRRCFSPAWSTMLGLEARPFRLSVLGALRLRLAAPERRWICGIERRRKQPAFIDVDGTRVGLY
jgi:hypothetical protein